MIARNVERLAVVNGLPCRSVQSCSGSTLAIASIIPLRCSGSCRRHGGGKVPPKEGNCILKSTNLSFRPQRNEIVSSFGINYCSVPLYF